MARLNDKTKLKVMKLLGEGYNLYQISKSLGVPYSTVYSYHGRAVLEEAFPDRRKGTGMRLDEFARRAGGDDSRSPRMTYDDQRARQNGYDSHAEYASAQKKARQKRNKRLAKLIKSRLKRLGKNQNWLSRILKVSRQSVSEFASGKSRPRFEILPVVADALRVDFETLKRVGRYR